jgi:hypothetical protein
MEFAELIIMFFVTFAEGLVAAYITKVMCDGFCKSRGVIAGFAKRPKRACHPVSMPPAPACTKAIFKHEFTGVPNMKTSVGTKR